MPEDPELRARERLREAVRQIPVKPGLDARVRRALDGSRFDFWLHFRYGAAVLAFCIGVALAPGLQRKLRPTGVEGQLNQAGPLFRTGLGMHLECALQLGPTPVGPADRGPLDSDMAGVEGLIETSSPAGEQVLESHSCRYRGRRFTHVVLRGPSGLTSVVIGPRGRSDDAIRQITIDGYAVTTSGSGLYIVSRHGLAEDRATMDRLAPRLRLFSAGVVTARQSAGSAEAHAGFPAPDLPASR